MLQAAQDEWPESLFFSQRCADIVELFMVHVDQHDVGTLIRCNRLEMDIRQEKSVDMACEESVCRSRPGPSWFRIVGGLLTVF